MLAEFIGDAANDVIDAGLGAHVSGMVVQHDRSRCGTDLNQGAAAAVQHAAQHALEKLERADELQGRHPGKLIPGGVEERFDETPSGGVDRDVDTAEPPRGAFCQRPEFRFGRYIAQAGMAADLGRQRLERVAMTARDQHLSPLGGQPPGDDLTHIVLTGRADNYRSFANETLAHASLPEFFNRACSR